MNSISLIIVVVAVAAVSSTPVAEVQREKSGKLGQSTWQDLSQEQQQCLIDVFKAGSEDVKRAMRECRILDKGAFLTMVVH